MLNLSHRRYWHSFGFFPPPFHLHDFSTLKLVSSKAISDPCKVSFPVRINIVPDFIFVIFLNKVVNVDEH